MGAFSSASLPRKTRKAIRAWNLVKTLKMRYRTRLSDGQSAPKDPPPARSIMARRLDDVAIQRWISDNDGWSRTGDLIEKTYQLPSFMGSIEFVRRIADLAEEADHHPDLDIRYDSVRVGLSTHSEGGITDLDTMLAEKIEAVVQG